MCPCPSHFRAGANIAVIAQLLHALFHALKELRLGDLESCAREALGQVVL